MYQDLGEFDVESYNELKASIVNIVERIDEFLSFEAQNGNGGI